MGWLWTAVVSTALVLCCTVSGCKSPPSRRLLPDTDGALFDGSIIFDVFKPDAQCGGLVCPLGCNVEAGRCNRLAPSNFDVQGFFDAEGLTVCPFCGCFPGANTIVIDTDTGRIVCQNKGSVTIRPSGNPGLVLNGIFWDVTTQSTTGYPNLKLSVFGMKSFEVPLGWKLEVKGKLPVALYATGDVKIEGQVVSLPEMSDPGAGGFDGGSDTSRGMDGSPCPDESASGHGKAGEADPDRFSGGGGGGRKQIGGTGGDAGGAGGISLVLGGEGGQAVGNPELTPLFGGCGGGTGRGAHMNHGGGGGGAIQISANGSLSISGMINMPGAGGGGGWTRVSNGCSGGGGGSGGAILLEAAQITVTGEGMITSNGGGGGAGGFGSDGESGLAATTPAKGGSSSWGGGGGGAGGARGTSGSSLDEAGGNGEDHVSAAGGGGGSAGRIRFNAPSINIDPSAVVSPEPSESKTVRTW